MRKKEIRRREIRQSRGFRLAKKFHIVMLALGIVVTLFLVSSFVITQRTGLSKENSTASILSTTSSFFKKIGSSISETVGGVFNLGKTSASCVPPVSPKPSGQQHALGTMTITPETQEETKDSTITVSLVSHIDSSSVQLGTDPRSPYRWSTFKKENIIDWGPKPAEFPNGGKGVSITMDSESIAWGAHEYFSDNGRILQKAPRLPAQTYWVKLKASQTSPWESNNNTGSYGWKEIQYEIHYVEGAGLRTENFKTASGKNMYYVGGPQYPTGAVARVGNNVDANLDDDRVPHYGKSVTVKAGEPLEIEAKPTGWQGGTFTINTGTTGHIVGEKSITVKAGESAVFKVLPRGTYPVKGSVTVENACNDVFAKQFSSRYFSTSAGSFEAPIRFDFKGVSKEKMRLTFQGGSFALDFKKPGASFTITPWLSLMYDGVVVTNAPNQSIAIEAVYKDNPSEIAKHIVISPAQAATSKEGTANFKVSAPNVTKEEVSRGILLRVSALDIPGLTGEVPIVFTGVAIELIKPQVPIPPPTPTTNLSVKQVLVSSNRTVSELAEEETVVFTAKFVMSDGSVKTATHEVVWGVLGDVGSITATGVFKAKLGDSIAEAGEGFGFVTATYRDILGQSPLIKVKANITSQQEDEWGG